jgi:hypothetical protein
MDIQMMSIFHPKLQDILFTWVSPPLALLNIMWKMEGSSEKKIH